MIGTGCIGSCKANYHTTVRTNKNVTSHMAKPGRFPHLHTLMRLSISMAIFQKFAILEITEFMVNLRCAKVYPDAVLSSIPKFQFILI